MAATAEQKKDRTFSYVFLIAPDLAPEEAEAWNYAEILEMFLQLEQEAANEAAMWPFGWGSHMSRVAPVQVTRALDVRPLAVHVLGPPRFRFNHPAIFGGSIMYFAAPQLKPVSAGDNKDGDRFLAVAEASLGAARRRRQGLLLIAGWGWGHEAELAAEQQVALMAAEFPFVDRQVP